MTSRISAVALGCSVGVVNVLWVVVLGFVAMYFNFGHEWVKFAGTLYVGYAATFMGIVLGALWSFVCGFVFGALIAVFYNFFDKYCNKDVKA